RIAVTFAARTRTTVGGEHANESLALWPPRAAPLGLCAGYLPHHPDDVSRGDALSAPRSVARRPDPASGAAARVPFLAVVQLRGGDPTVGRGPPPPPRARRPAGRSAQPGRVWIAARGVRRLRALQGRRARSGDAAELRPGNARGLDRAPPLQRTPVPRARRVQRGAPAAVRRAGGRDARRASRGAAVLRRRRHQRPRPRARLSQLRDAHYGDQPRAVGLAARRRGAGTPRGTGGARHRAETPDPPSGAVGRGGAPQAPRAPRAVRGTAPGGRVPRRPAAAMERPWRESGARGGTAARVVPARRGERHPRAARVRAGIAGLRALRERGRAGHRAP